VQDLVGYQGIFAAQNVNFALSALPPTGIEFNALKPEWFRAGPRPG
jgi:hypothetical protein